MVSTSPQSVILSSTPLAYSNAAQPIDLTVSKEAGRSIFARLLDEVLAKA